MPGRCLQSFHNHYLKVWLWWRWRNRVYQTLEKLIQKLTWNYHQEETHTYTKLTYFLFSHHNPLIYAHICAHLTETEADAAAAKLLQSCLTLCDPIDSSPPGSLVPGILQARTPEWVATSFSNAWKWKVKVKSLSHVRLPATHGLQPTRLLHPWDFLGKSTGVHCHCLLLACIKITWWFPKTVCWALTLRFSD